MVSYCIIHLLKKRNTRLVPFVLLFLLTFTAAAQRSKSQKPERKSPAQKSEAKKTTSRQDESSPAQEEKVKDIISFLQYMLNTIGSGETAASDKEVLITESYSKIFRDDKVQVEDDLDENRKVITNKDVVAYLKDVDFFFRDVKFELNIENISASTLANGNLFYKVSARRNLRGTTSDGQEVNNTMPRYIEINYNPESKDLKIVSIYTNEFNEKEALTNWWNSLSYEWQAIFRRKLNLTDSVSLDDIKNITAIEDLDLSENKYIRNIDPLGELVNLKLLNLSATTIEDLTPIRNLTELVELDLSNTNIRDLSPLRYSAKLARLNIDHTKVVDISVVQKMPALQNLEMSTVPVNDFASLSGVSSLLNLDLEATQISDLSVLENISRLMELNISRTPVHDLQPLIGFNNLTVLNIDSTRIEDLQPLSKLGNLEILYANFTPVHDLTFLQKLQHLEKIYCDQTSIDRETADRFMAANPGVLVIFDSKDLQAWWSALSSGWQRVLGNAAAIALPPSKEELAKVTNLDSINFSGNSNIDNLEPLQRLQKLRVILAAKTPLRDITPLRDHREIQYLDISETQVSDISVVRGFANLKVFRADHTPVENIEPLYGIKNLEMLYADSTTVHDYIAREFFEKNPRCLIIYKTTQLNRWWENLPRNWKGVFQKIMGKDTVPTREDLHKLVEREILHFDDVPVRDLSALGEFVRLKELHFSGTRITEIPPLENIRQVKSLHATHSPIQNIESLALLVEMEDLDISGTPVDDLKPLEDLQRIKTLQCSGTQIRKLDPLENLVNLQFLDCSNTRIRKLGPVFSLPLTTLKCYNTKVSGREIKRFRENSPECAVVYYR